MTTGIAIYYETGSGGSSTQLFPRQNGDNGTRGIVDPLDLGGVEITRFLQPVPFGPGQIELGYVYDKPRRVSFDINSRCASEANALQEFRDLSDLFNPTGPRGNAAPFWLRADWTEGPDPVSRYLAVRPLARPGLGWGVGGRASFKGLYSAGVLRFPVELEALYPFWRDYTALTSDTALSFHSTPRTVVITTPGDVTIGCRIEILAVTGSCTAISVASSATGVDGEAGGTLNWSKGSAFTAGDYVDFRYSDPSVVTISAGVLSATDYLRLFHSTSNTLTFTKVTGSPSNLTARVTYRRAWF